MAEASDVLSTVGSARYPLDADALPPSWGDALDALDRAGPHTSYE